MSSDVPRATHRRTVSSPVPARLTRRPTDPDSTHVRPRTSTPHTPLPAASSSSALPRAGAASRIMISVRRSLTPSSAAPTKKKQSDVSKSGMYSTPEERDPHHPPRFRSPDPSSSSRPTIEQIAMGLHVSRTPHLRPLGSSHYAFSQRSSAPHTAPSPHHRSPNILPPPPSRSSMKKPSTGSSESSPAISPHFSSASASTTTVTSLTPSAQPTNVRTSLKVRMARLLPGSKAASAPPSTAAPSPRESVEFPVKKAVRFSTDDEDEP